MSFPDKETTGLIAAPHGQLDVLITPTAEFKLNKIMAIICHPHPLHGGTMHNKVVTTLARTYREMGIASVRFNYRGVGLSSGHYAQTVGRSAGFTNDYCLAKPNSANLYVMVSWFFIWGVYCCFCCQHDGMIVNN